MLLLGSRFLSSSFSYYGALFGLTRLFFLLHSDGVRCTPSGSLIAKPCTVEEVAFYESSALHPAVQEFMPLYIGTLSAGTDQQQQLLQNTSFPVAVSELDQSKTCANGAEGSSSTVTTADVAPWIPSGGRKIDTGLSIVLENVACGFTKPNVLDVKLGARLWADDAPPSKRVKLDEVARQTTSGSLGFRIAGMKTWTGMSGKTATGAQTDPYEIGQEGSEGAQSEIIDKDGFRRYDRWYGRSFDSNNVKEGFETFLGGAKMGKIDRSKLIAKRLAHGLSRLQSVLEAEETRMYSSSVLIVYEGDPDAMEHSLEEEKRAPENWDEFAQEGEGEEDDDDEVDLEQVGSLVQFADIKDIKIGNGVETLPHQTINIDIDRASTALGGIEEEEEDDDDDQPPKVHDLRLIDFAHAQWTSGHGPDENVLLGIRSLVNIFNLISSDAAPQAGGDEQT